MIRASGRRLSNALVAIVVVVVIAAAVAIPEPARALEYPSWSDVESARSDETAKQAQISELKAYIAGLAADLVSAEEIAQSRGAEYERAQAAFDEATYRAGQLQEQADEAELRAGESHEQLGRIASTFAKTAAVPDLSLGIFLDTGDGTDVLYKLGAMSKLSDLTSTLLSNAESEKNNARSLGAQAAVAKQSLGELAAEAEKSLKAAVAARLAVQDNLDRQEANAGRLNAQLAVLTEDRAATEADFEKGEKARKAAEAKAAAEAAAAAADAADAARDSDDSGQLSGQGWALPVSGWISDRFGPRPDRPVAGVGAFHYGTDLAAGCGQPVYAATAGTVVYAGWLGSYGNWVLVDHGSGIQTGYAHNSAVLVSEGERVAAGERVALVGTTGASSGCHLHFETRVDGARIDPQPFMSARGVQLG